MLSESPPQIWTRAWLVLLHADTHHRSVSSTSSAATRSRGLALAYTPETEKQGTRAQHHKTCNRPSTCAERCLTPSWHPQLWLTWACSEMSPHWTTLRDRTVLDTFDSCLLQSLNALLALEGQQMKAHVNTHKLCNHHPPGLSVTRTIFCS